MAKSLLEALNEGAKLAKLPAITKEYLRETNGGRTLSDEEREELWKKIEREGGYECLA